MDIIANWIWSDDSDGRGYNLCSIFRRDFRLAALPVTARLAVTADSFYRLKVNGQWLNDGPCRSWGISAATHSVSVPITVTLPSESAASSWARKPARCGSR